VQVRETAQPPEFGLGEWPFHFADDEPSPLPPSPSSFDVQRGLHEVDGLDGLVGLDGFDVDADDENDECDFLVLDFDEFIPFPDSLSPPSSQEYNDF